MTLNQALTMVDNRIEKAILRGNMTTAEKLEDLRLYIIETWEQNESSKFYTFDPEDIFG